MSGSPNAEITTLLALSLGRQADFSRTNWERVFRAALVERCAPLSWLRSGPVIRGSAPVAIVEAWRREAIASYRMSAFWQSVIGEVLPILASAGVSATILKGIPLGQRLYGDDSARPSFDLDLYIPLEARHAAETALRRAGLTWLRGAPPREATYQVSRRGLSGAVEVHSALLDGALTAHLRFRAPGTEVRPVGGTLASVHADDQLPAYLAAHLANHRVRPLLWFIDFATLWNLLNADERGRATDAASAVGAHRYLDWAVRNAAWIEGAASGDAASLRLLGFRNGVRRERHPAALTASLASSWRDAISVWSAWAAPKVFRSRWPAMNRETIENAARKVIFSIRGTRQGYRGVVEAGHVTGAARRTLSIGTADFGALVEELVHHQRDFLLYVEGNSMSPEIPSGSVVRLSPLNEPEVAIGRVVLAKLGEGRYAVHRVVERREGFVVLRGDANAGCDPPVRAEGLLAVAVERLVDGVPVPIGGESTLHLLRAKRLMRAMKARLRLGGMSNTGTRSTWTKS